MFTLTPIPYWPTLRMASLIQVFHRMSNEKMHFKNAMITGNSNKAYRDIEPKRFVRMHPMEVDMSLFFYPLSEPVIP